MKPECDATKSVLGAYADKELDAAQAVRVEQHLAACPDCQRELVQIEQLHKLVKSVPHPELAEDYWNWQQSRVWRRINHERRGLAKPLRRPLLSIWSFSAAAGLVVVAVVVIAGWRMLGQGSLGDIGRYLMMEKTTGTRPESVATLSKTASAEARSDNREPEPSTSVDEIAVGNEVEGQGTGLAGARRGGTAGAVGAASPEPVAGALRARHEGMAATGPKDKDEVAEPMLGQASATGQPVASGAAADLAPAPPVYSGKGMRTQSEKPEGSDLTPTLLSEPILPEVGESDTGTAVLRLTTDSLGFVTVAVVTRTSGRALNDSIAVLNARASRFKPFVRDGRPLGSAFQRQYHFRAAK
ncbi:MAG: zf-HC2 domain-containing protein [candidate division WOR-3 bacterium]|nr:zf-HC2 domain-containing protein [candidate division WOR-3 bacterium]